MIISEHPSTACFIILRLLVMHSHSNIHTTGLPLALSSQEAFCMLDVIRAEWRGGDLNRRERNWGLDKEVKWQ